LKGWETSSSLNDNPGGGLFTRSGSGAGPFFAERLFPTANF
jgi:hypothetical protein